MSARFILLAGLVAAALLWVLIAEPSSGEARGSHAVVSATPRAMEATAGPVHVPLAQATHLVSSAPPVDEQLDELVRELDELHARGRIDRDIRGLDLLTAFVQTVAGAEQQAEAVLALERRFDASSPRAPEQAWTAARLLVALGGLGAGDAAFSRLEQVPENERADVLMGLVWDPLDEGDGVVLEIAELNRLLPNVPLLPVTTGRIAPAAAQPLLAHLAGEVSRSGESLQLRNAAIAALGVGINQLPGPATTYRAFLDREPASSSSALRPTLFVLLSADGGAARGLLNEFQRRHAATAEENVWLGEDMVPLPAEARGKALLKPMCGGAFIDQFVQVERVARRKRTADHGAALTVVLDATRSPDDRLDAAYGLLAWTRANADELPPADVRESVEAAILERVAPESEMALRNVLGMMLTEAGASTQPTSLHALFDCPF